MAKKGDIGDSLSVPVRIRPQTITLMGTMRGFVAGSASPPLDVFPSMMRRGFN